jgi:hypothetical protein
LCSNSRSRAAAFGWRALNHLAWNGDLAAATLALDGMPPSDDDFAMLPRSLVEAQALELLGRPAGADILR